MGRRRRASALLLLWCAPSALPAEDERQQPIAIEDLAVASEPPRILLRPQRLRLLRRERERQSARWQQFELLAAGGAQFAEPGFANALYYQVSGDRTAADRAIAYAMRPAADLRQTAIVFDWCQHAMNQGQSEALAGKLKRALKEPAQSRTPERMRALTFAAVAIADHDAELSRRVLYDVVARWWRAEVSPKLKAGALVFHRNDLFPVVELLHVVRDNVLLDLREDAARWFMDQPPRLLLSYYPAVMPSAENDYRIPMYQGDGEPDLRAVALARVTELALVAYDPNLRNSQFLQGWLMHDRFELRSPFGAPYEFLWANPYLPGLSYYHMPLYFHDKAGGELYLRSSWDEDAHWFALAQGRAQIYENGKRIGVTGTGKRRSIDIGDATVVSAAVPLRLERGEGSPANVFVVGLQPATPYIIEVDDEEAAELFTDSGGTLPIFSTRTDTRTIRVYPSR